MPSLTHPSTHQAKELADQLMTRGQNIILQGIPGHVGGAAIFTLTVWLVCALLPSLSKLSSRSVQTWP